MIGAQILGLITSFIILFTVFFGYRRRKISRMDSLLWVIISFAIIFFAIRPQTPIRILDFITVERFNALMISGFLLLLVLVLRIHLRLEDTNRTLTILVQQIAMDQFQKDTKTQITQSLTFETRQIDDKNSL